MDFNSFAWVRPDGIVLVDPLPLSDHDCAELERRGPIARVVVTNGDHVRGALEIVDRYGAELVAPRGERSHPAFSAARLVGHGDEVVDGLVAIELDGSKTQGELALLLDQTTLVTGDLVRAPRGGSLAILPDAKLFDRAAAIASVHRLLENTRVDAVLVGDGWPIFRGARTELAALVAELMGG